MEVITWLVFITLILFLLSSVPIGISLGVAVLITMQYVDLPTSFFTSKLFGALDNFPLMAVPFFIMSGEIMQRGSMAQSLLNFSRSLLGHVNGGLALISVVTCLFYGALCGAAAATMAAVGGIMIPAMEKDGYPKDFATAVNAAGGTLGVMIPPSVPLILIGASSGVSISDLFIAGIFPGLLVGLGIMVVSYIMVRKNCYGHRKPRASLREVMGALGDAKYALIVPIIVLGGIYGGLTTPTEAGVIAVVYALVAEGLILRTLSLKDTFAAFNASARTTAVIFLVVATATTLGHILMYYNIPDVMLTSIQQITNNPNVTIFIMIIIFLILGTFMDTGATILILTPMLMPVIRAQGIDPIHFGIIMIVTLAYGTLTPPLGLNLFVGCSISKVSIERLFIKVLPFLGVMLLMLLIIAYVPAISLFLLR